jgi:hypothetical protein
VTGAEERPSLSRIFDLTRPFVSSNGKAGPDQNWRTEAYPRLTGNASSTVAEESANRRADRSRIQKSELRSGEGVLQSR